MSTSSLLASLFAWRSIDLAPRDGRPILVCGGAKIAVVAWSAEGWRMRPGLRPVRIDPGAAWAPLDPLLPVML